MSWTDILIGYLWIMGGLGWIELFQRRRDDKTLSLGEKIALVIVWPVFVCVGVFWTAVAKIAAALFGDSETAT